MSAKTIAISLKRDGKVIATMDVAKGCEPILVGRSHSCALQTPPDDKSVSGRHARLYWKGGSLYLEDMGSSNGIYFNGRRLDKPIKVEVDGLYAIGSCLLVAGRAESRSSGVRSESHKLEFMNGDRAGQMVDIKPKQGDRGSEFAIGLDPGCDLCLPDMMVSRRHARLSVKGNGDCWIADEGSSNGTYVNGEKLTGRERLLKDGDKISIAYFDLRFLDGGVKHTKVNIMARLILLLATLGVLATGYVVWKFNPGRRTASDYRTLASQAAAEERFDLAATYIDEADVARNAEAERMQNDALRSQIRQWEDTYKGWGEVRAAFEAGKLKDARLKLAAMLGDGYAWSWNQTTAAEMRRDAEFSGSLVRILTDTADVVSRAEKSGISRAELAAAEGAARQYLSAQAAPLKSRPYLASAVKRLEGALARLREIDDGLSQTDSALASLAEDSPDMDAVIGRLSATADDERLPYGVRAYAKGTLPICSTFKNALAFLEREKAMVSDLDFESVRKGQSSLPLPSKDECAAATVFSDFRAKLMARHDENLNNVSILFPMVRNLESAGVRSTDKGRLFTLVASESAWDTALSFDCFQGRFPLSSRVDPCGTYDDLVGIERTYENLRNLPKPPGRQTSVVMNFVPKCQTAKAAYDQVRTFMQFLDRPDMQGFRSGKLGRLYALCAQIMADRDKIIAMLKKRSKESAADRTKIVAGYYAEYFSDDPSYADLRALEMAFKSLQKKVAEMNEQYESETDPEKRIALRDKIIATGIPGMEQVRMRWVEATSE